MNSASRAEGANLKRDVLLQFRRMMEINADIDRNRSDALFARPGRQIQYVLDQNIFELFIRPAARANYVAAFLPGRGGRDRVASDRFLSAESAMISAEYLLSGELPGQQGGPILMTEWHFWELNEQMHEHRTRLQARVQNHNQVQSFFDGLGEIESADSPAGAETLELLLRNADGAVVTDVHQLRREGWPEEALCRFILTRRATRLLVADHVIEPIQQLDRIFSDEIAPRLRPLHLAFPLPANARAQLAEDTKDWMRRLVAEQKRRAERPGPEQIKPRPHGSLATDARSLAYILWVATKRATSAMRVVFVTGDHLMFDAYRRWHATAAPSDPFVLRRPVQYAPFLNLNDTPNDVSDARDLFERTRRAVEVPLMVLNLNMRPETQPGAQEVSMQIAAQRELLLLQLAELEDPAEHPSIAFFLNSRDVGWWQAQLQELQGTRDSWQTVERLAIGANFHLVSRRLDAAQRMRAMFVAQTGADQSGPLVVDLARRLLDRIVVASIRVWFPLAVDFIRTFDWAEVAGRMERRAPIVLRLSLLAPPGHSQATVNVNSLLDACEAGEPWARNLLDVETNPHLADRQHVVFAVAASFALRLALWSQADRYADLASIAADAPSVAGDINGGASDDAEECRYLRALTLRFRLGSFSPFGAHTVENVWLRWLERAEANLNKCASYHRDPISGPRQILRELRAMSERAAVRLFYATWVAAAGKDSLAPLLSLEDGIRCLLAAVEDLRQCLSLATDIRVEALDGERQAFLKRVRIQVIANCAASEVLLHLYNVNHRLEFASGLFGDTDAIAAELQAVLAATPPIPSAVRVDIWAFLTLRHADQQAERSMRELLAQHRASGGLAIDRSLTDAVRHAMATGTLRASCATPTLVQTEKQPPDAVGAAP